MEKLKVELETLNQKFEDFKGETKHDLGVIGGKIDTLIELSQDGKLKHELMKRELDDMRIDFTEYKAENRKEINDLKDRRKSTAWIFALGGVGFTILGSILTYLIIFVIEHN